MKMPNDGKSVLLRAEVEILAKVADGIDDMDGVVDWALGGSVLSEDEVFIESLRKRGVSQRIIDEAIVVTHNNNITHSLSELQENDQTHD